MITMRKNNAWNRLFHKAEVQNNLKQMSIYTKQCLEGQRFLDKIEGPNTLITLMNIHKELDSRMRILDLVLMEYLEH